LAADVQVVVLARSPAAGPSNREALDLLRTISVGGKKCEMLVLDRRSDQDRFGTSTFHFKTACADGQHVYLGSANFNTAGLASRWELGVMLGGSSARTVCTLVDSLLAAARPLPEA
jgi:hypothetical protein